MEGYGYLDLDRLDDYLCTTPDCSESDEYISIVHFKQSILISGALLIMSSLLRTLFLNLFLVYRRFF